MVKKIESCIFISGRGSNLKSIIESSSNNNFPIKVSLIISNNVKAKGIKYAKKHNIPFKYYSSKNQNFFEKSCINELKKKKIKFICLAGFMKVLSKKFIESFGYKILNIHPSLLPKYRGLDTHKKVLLNKEKYSGCTVHYVTPEIDSGNIILQKKVKIKKNETKTSLTKKILVEENKLYSKAIKLVLK
jgi:formyltetrahydrofolate-dependent phosphoribosylglycinamide formyltransferase